MTTMDSSSGMNTTVSDRAQKMALLFLAIFVPFFVL